MAGPLNVSLDTQLLINYLVGEEYDEESIVDCEEKIQSTNNSDKRKSLQRSQHRLLKNYIVFKFIRHLINEGKLNINITPTAMAEIIYSQKFHQLLVDKRNIDKLVEENISTKTIIEIIKKYLSTHNYKNIDLVKILSEVQDWQSFRFKEDRANSLPPGSNHYIHEIQKEVLKRLKLNICQNSLLTQKPESYFFINFPFENSPLDNPLLKNILQLSETYRIDQKPLKKENGKFLADDRRVPIQEINDTTIMATCSLLGLPLLTEDSKGLSSLQDIFEDANKKYGKKHTGTLPLGAPFSLESFVGNFFKEEFIEFASKFQIPEEIARIDKKNLISSCIKNIKHITPEAKLVDSRKNDNDICSRNIEHYNSRYELLSQNNPNLEILNCNEFCEEQTSAKRKGNIVNFIETTRQIEHKVFLDILQEKFAIFKHHLLGLECQTWGLSQIDKTTLKRSKKPKNPSNIAQKSKQCFDELLSIINHLVKRVYGQHISNIDFNLFQQLQQLGIELIDNKYGIYGVEYKGIKFTLPQKLDKEDLNNQKLLLTYNLTKLDDVTILLMGTNPRFSGKFGISTRFDEYITRFKNRYPDYALEDPYHAYEIQKIFNNNTQPPEEYVKLDIKEESFIKSIEQDQSTL